MRFCLPGLCPEGSRALVFVFVLPREWSVPENTGPMPRLVKMASSVRCMAAKPERVRSSKPHKCNSPCRAYNSTSCLRPGSLGRPAAAGLRHADDHFAGQGPAPTVHFQGKCQHVRRPRNAQELLVEASAIRRSPTRAMESSAKGGFRMACAAAMCLRRYVANAAPVAAVTDSRNRPAGVGAGREGRRRRIERRL